MTSRLWLGPGWACAVICLCMVSICSPVLAEEINGLSVGMYHICVAYKETGRVKCRGKDPFETSLPFVRIPDFVPGLQNVGQISCGNGHDCAILKNGQVFCWGRNWKGQLGDGTTKDSATPVRVKNLPGKAISVRLGQVHTCALVVVTKKKVKTTKVYCWGLNRYLDAGPQRRTPIGRPRLVKNMGVFKNFEAGGERLSHLCTGGETKTSRSMLGHEFFWIDWQWWNLCGMHASPGRAQLFILCGA